MGFKKTTDGRVFFHGAFASQEDSPAPSAKESALRKKTVKNTVQPAAPSGQGKPSALPKAANMHAAPKPDSGEAPTAVQVQTLQLLRVLNDKLQSAQAERKKMRAELAAYRKKVATLEAAKTHADHARTDAAQKELKETRALLADIEQRTAIIDENYNALITQAAEHKKTNIALTRKQIQLENRQRQYDFPALVARIEANEAQQEELTGRVTEAMNQQASLMRKLEQAMEERARFMRKIERIEETVIHTRDALNAKAMVVLSDQQKQGAGGMHMPRAISSHASGAVQTAVDKPFWRESWRLGTTMMLGACAAAIMGGWFISHLQNPGAPAPSGAHLSAWEAPVQESLPVETSAGDKWRLRDDHSAFLTEEAAEALPGKTVVQEASTALEVTHPAELEALLASNPRAVGGALNKIRPGA